jgi:hypothetical protein
MHDHATCRFDREKRSRCVTDAPQDRGRPTSFEAQIEPDCERDPSDFDTDTE